MEMFRATPAIVSSKTSNSRKTVKYVRIKWINLLEALKSERASLKPSIKFHSDKYGFLVCTMSVFVCVCVCAYTFPNIANITNAFKFIENVGCCDICWNTLSIVFYLQIPMCVCRLQPFSVQIVRWDHFKSQLSHEYYGIAFNINTVERNITFNFPIWVLSELF